METKKQILKDKISKIGVGMGKGQGLENRSARGLEMGDGKGGPTSVRTLPYKTPRPAKPVSPDPKIPQPGIQPGGPSVRPPIGPNPIPKPIVPPGRYPIGPKPMPIKPQPGIGQWPQWPMPPVRPPVGPDRRPMPNPKNPSPTHGELKSQFENSQKKPLPPETPKKPSPTRGWQRDNFKGKGPSWRKRREILRRTAKHRSL